MPSRFSKISCLCLLDLSAAFDTIDHNILLSRLSSWFGITGTVLDYGSNLICPLVLSVWNAIVVSPPSIPVFAAFQGSVLGPLLFIIYTTPLSSLISSLSLNHHLPMIHNFSLPFILQMYTQRGRSRGGLYADRKRTQKWHFEHRPWNYARQAAPKRRKTAKNRIRKPLQPKPEAEIWRKPRQWVRRCRLPIRLCIH